MVRVISAEIEGYHFGTKNEVELNLDLGLETSCFCQKTVHIYDGYLLNVGFG